MMSFGSVLVGDIKRGKNNISIHWCNDVLSRKGSMPLTLDAWEEFVRILEEMMPDIENLDDVVGAGHSGGLVRKCGDGSVDMFFLNIAQFKFFFALLMNYSRGIDVRQSFKTRGSKT